MKKRYLLFIICLLFMPTFVYASSDVINDFDMEIYIDSNGDANVTETWNATANMGTEFYHSYYNYGTSRFSNFKVTMDGEPYTYIENWNLDASLYEKAYKNGFNYVNDGIELCFGKTAMGTHTYISKYKISNFILETADSQIAYWTLISYNNGGQFQNIHIKIYSDFTYEDTLDVWGYGNYGGTAYVYDGYIEMNSEGRLDDDEYMTILIKFPLGSFNTLNKNIDTDFDYYYNMAETGAVSYKKDSGSILRGIISFIGQFFWFFIFVIPGILTIKYNANKLGKYRLDFGKRGKKLSKELPFFREIPCDKNIYDAYFMSLAFRLVKNKTDILGAVLLKWLKEDKIAIKKINNGSSNNEFQAIDLKESTFELDYELELYTMMKKAARDNWLEKHEFEKWCKKHYKEILGWFDKVLDKTGATFETKEYLTHVNGNKYLVTDKMFGEAEKLKGLKQFLIEFSRIGEKVPIEVHLWEEYLMFAQIFGIAKEVAKQFKNLYPNLLENNNYDFDTIIFINTVSHDGMRSASIARAESYSSGGGGFSSGGGGGGSFGGGGGGGMGGR